MIAQSRSAEQSNGCAGKEDQDADPDDDDYHTRAGDPRSYDCITIVSIAKTTIHDFYDFMIY